MSSSWYRASRRSEFESPTIYVSLTFSTFFCGCHASPPALNLNLNFIPIDQGHSGPTEYTLRFSSIVSHAVSTIAAEITLTNHIPLLTEMCAFCLARVPSNLSFDVNSICMEAVCMYYAMMLVGHSSLRRSDSRCLIAVLSHPTPLPTS